MAITYPLHFCEKMALDMYKIHRIIIYSFVLIFEFFGLFGNINLIILTYRKKSLRTNYGLLLGLLAFFHTMCLIYEFINIGFAIATTYFDYKIHRDVCFISTFPHIGIHCLQTGTMCIISLDLLITIVFPLKYRNIRKMYYFPVLFFLPVCYSIDILISGWVYMDSDIIQMCNPPSSVPPKVTEKWYAIMMVFSVTTVIFYVSAFSILYYKTRKRSSDVRLIEKKALKTLKFLILAFLFTRFITTSLFNILKITGIRNDYLVLVQNYSVVPAIIAYSQNAYICFFRSAEYRYLLTEQIRMFSPKLASKLPTIHNVSDVLVQSTTLYRKGPLKKIKTTT